MLAEEKTFASASESLATIFLGPNVELVSQALYPETFGNQIRVFRFSNVEIRCILDRGDFLVEYRDGMGQEWVDIDRLTEQIGIPPIPIRYPLVEDYLAAYRSHLTKIAMLIQHGNTT